MFPLWAAMTKETQERGHRLFIFLLMHGSRVLKYDRMCVKPASWWLGLYVTLHSKKQLSESRAWRNNADPTEQHGLLRVE